ncbi:MAG TPA: F0F1 ATP synthase subunit B [Acidimicrobiia bacterium]|nr:F0F1 ATP synthase subunit B [Acidimicrobiia bacterium]
MQLLTALAVLATEEGAESGGGLSLILPPTSELIAGIIAFLIVFWFVGRRAMPMINRTLEARQQAITGQLSEAEEAKREAESLLADYRAQLADAKTEGNRIIEEARASGEQLKADIVARAEEEAASTLAKARDEAQSEKSRALAEARREVGEISVGLAERIVGGSLDGKMQQDLIDRYLADLEKL